MAQALDFRQFFSNHHMGAALPLLLMGLVSCASVERFDYQHDEFIRTYVSDHPPQAEEYAVLAWEFAGDELQVSVVQWRQCLRQPLRVVDRKVSHERRLHQQPVWVRTVLGSLLAGAGAYALVDPSFPSGADQEDRNFAMGITGASLGGLLLVWSAVDLFRAIDTSEDLGEFEIPVGKATVAPCAETNGQGASVSLRIPGIADPLVAPVDQNGVARFNMQTVADRVDPKHTTGFLVYADHEEPVALLHSPAVQKSVSEKVK